VDIRPQGAEQKKIFPRPRRLRVTPTYKPMVVRRCSPAIVNGSRKFAFASCFKLLKQTQHKLGFGLILFKIMSHQVVLRFRLKWMGVLLMFSLNMGSGEVSVFEKETQILE